MSNNQLTIDNGQLTKKKISNVKSQMLNEKGQSLMELIVVIAVIVFVVGALTFATIASLRNAVFAQNQAQATKLAQEALERVRVGRDRDKNFTGLVIGSNNVTSWAGNNTTCSTNTGSIWCNQINGNCGTLTPPTYCFFNVTNQGILNYAGVSETIPPGAESIPPFQRAIVISDDTSSYILQKTVTAIVIWRDVSGSHESRLTTILRKI